MNREVASMFATSSVIYDSVDAALDSAINFNKEASGYVQYLTGEERHHRQGELRQPLRDRLHPR